MQTSLQCSPGLAPARLFTFHGPQGSACPQECLEVSGEPRRSWGIKKWQRMDSIIFLRTVWIQKYVNVGKRRGHSKKTASRRSKYVQEDRFSAAIHNSATLHIAVWILTMTSQRWSRWRPRVRSQRSQAHPATRRLGCHQTPGGEGQGPSHTGYHLAAS